jgi:FOG: GGDEF domain
MITTNTEELHKLVFTLAWNDAFGCYTRSGFEKLIWPGIADQARWIIYFDIDNMHALNESHGGYEPVDAKIHQVLGIVRKTDYAAGQYKSGDEFLVCITDAEGRETTDPTGLMYRLMKELKKQGMTATFAIVPVLSMDLSVNVLPAVRKVFEIKQTRGKEAR